MRISQTRLNWDWRTLILSVGCDENGGRLVDVYVCEAKRRRRNKKSRIEPRCHRTHIHTGCAECSRFASEIKAADELGGSRAELKMCARSKRLELVRRLFVCV